MQFLAGQNHTVENLILRKLLWLNHGHTDLYGDDGEMQCANCSIDFKRAPIEEIQKKLLGGYPGKHG